MEKNKARPGYWAVIPAGVRYDQELPPNAKLLYGEITALVDKRGYCYAQNAYFAELFGLTDRSVSRLLATLVERGYLRIDVLRDPETQEVVERRIYALYTTRVDEHTPPDNFVGTPPDNAVGTPPDKNVVEINTRSDQRSPLPPKGGGAEGRPRRKRAPKSVPSWEPERFEGFWAAYPRDEDRAHAVEQWDKLPQDRALVERYGSEEALLRDIALGLKIHLECQDWQEGRGIPYAFRWLRDRRWTEKRKAVRPAPEARPARVIDSGEVPVW